MAARKARVMDKKPAAPKNIESDVWNAIAAFEQILEAIPNDRVALETLFEAYEQIGDRSRALDYLSQLAQTIAEEGDAEAAPDVINKLNAYVQDNPAVKALLQQLERLLVQKKLPSSDSQSETGKRKNIDITNELAMAWNLLQAGELSQEDYSNVVHDLSENSSKNVQVPISVLHVLQDRSFKNMEKVLKFLVKDSGMPIVSLSSFELPKEYCTLLPIVYPMHRGAIVFEQMSQDLLVAVLNPYDAVLQADVKRITGKKCHFYLTLASEYDNTLEKIKKAQPA
jgi:tetratricopeptide (TPR) repeat protein